MKVLIIGYGSIAKKHIAALRSIVPEVNFIALRSNKNVDKVEGVKNIYSIDEVDEINFILISNPSHLHFETLIDVFPLGVPILLEKPAITTNEQGKKLKKHLVNHHHLVQVGFNLRYLDSLIYIKDNLDINTLQEVNVYAGSYLPDWRPQDDFRKSYSANSKMGGGVHLDLIHELDYTTWICGLPTANHNILSNKSSLRINAIDYAHYILEYPNFNATITLNYYRKDAKRTIEFLTSETTYEVDIMRNRVKDLKDDKIVFESSQNIIDTYQDQMEHFISRIKNNDHSQDDLLQSIKILKLTLND